MNKEKIDYGFTTYAFEFFDRVTSSVLFVELGIN